MDGKHSSSQWPCTLVTCFIKRISDTFLISNTLSYSSKAFMLIIWWFLCVTAKEIYTAELSPCIISSVSLVKKIVVSLNNLFPFGTFLCKWRTTCLFIQVFHQVDYMQDVDVTHNERAFVSVIEFPLGPGSLFPHHQWLFTTCTYSTGIASASTIKSGITRHLATMPRQVQVWVKQDITQPPWVAAVVWVVWRLHLQGFQARDRLLWTITVEPVEQEPLQVVVVLHHHPWHVVETTDSYKHNPVD